VVRNKFPEVAQAIEYLEQFSDPRLTGTGACLFSAFDSEVDAVAAKGQLPTNLAGFVAKGINRSPLERFLEANKILI